MSKAKALAEVAVSGKPADVARLAKKDPASARHWKPIMDAAYHGRAENLAALLRAGADPNILQGTADRHRPLTRCLEPKKTFPRGPEHLETTRVLIRAGADLDAPGGRHGWRPLAHAAFGGYSEAVELLIDAGAPVDGFLAAMLYDKRRLKAAIRRDPGFPRAQDAVGRTALHYLAASRLYQTVPGGAKKCVEVADLLLDAGAEVDAGYDIDEGEDPFRATALWWATAWQGNADLVRHLLLARGADGGNCIFSATFDGTPEVLECYADAGVGVDRVIEGRTPLLDLLRWRKPGAVPWLLEHGADPNFEDPDGRTALHLAAMTGAREDIVSALIEHGAKLAAKDRAGKTPLGLAKAAKKTKTVALLKAHGARQ